MKAFVQVCCLLIVVLTSNVFSEFGDFSKIFANASIYFENRPPIAPYEVPPLNPEHYPFRLQTKNLHASSKHSFKVFLFLPLLLAPATSTFLQDDTQSSTLLRSRWPNHLNLPCLTTSATLCTPRRLYCKSAQRFLSFSDNRNLEIMLAHIMID